MLTAATFDDATGSLVLTFDRAIDLTDLRPWDLTVVDENTAASYQGFGSATPVGDDGLQLFVTNIGPYDGAGVLLSATSDCGITAASDGTPWGGVDSLGLPFP